MRGRVGGTVGKGMRGGDCGERDVGRGMKKVSVEKGMRSGG